MNRVRIRPLVLAAAVAVPVLAGCEPAHAGAAAVVGGDRITTRALTDRVERSLQDPAAKQRFAADRAGFQRRVLTLLIDHLLIADAARREGVTVSASEVDAKLNGFATQAGSMASLVKQAAGAGIAKVDLRPYVRDLALTDKIGDRLVANRSVPADQLKQAYDAQFVQVHAAHILVKDKKTADSLLAQVKADPTKFAALAKKYSTDTGSKSNGGDLGTQPPSQYVAPFAAAVTTAAVGSFVEAHTQFGWHVIHVIDRKATKSFAAATPQLRRQLLQSVRERALNSLISRESKRVGVSVSPRFGRWDAAKTEVVAAKDKLSKPGKTGS